jgi:hypothetical protein
MPQVVIGVATAYSAWSEVRGAALQLAVNVAALVVATLAVQARGSTRAGADSRPS